MYTSGRTVKPRTRKPTALAAATADVRKLVRQYLLGVQGVTVTSNGTADPRTLAQQIRTVITFPAQTEYSVLLDMAIQRLAGFVSVTSDAVSITILRKI